MKNFLGSFRNRLTLVFGLTTLILALFIMLYFSDVASKAMTQANVQLLQSIARNMAHTMSDTLKEREREMILFSKSPLLKNRHFDRQDIRTVLNNMQSSYADYSWIGITDEKGVVQVATNGLLENVNVSIRPWFQQGSQSSYVGDVHEAKLLEKMLKPSEDPNEPIRFIDFASPIYDINNTLIGVIAAHANWAWAKRVFESAMPIDAKSRGIEIFVISVDGKILYPHASIGAIKIPERLKKTDGYEIMGWESDNQYLSVFVKVKSNVSTDLGWSIIVRQPISKALESVTVMHRNLLYLGIGISILYMLLAYYFSMQLSSPIEKLAKVSKLIGEGKKQADFNITSNLHEVQTLTDSLKNMVSVLLSHENELKEMNKTLEKKVQERTVALQDANEKLTHLSRHDTLTQLHNRLASNEYLHQEFLRMKRTHTPFSVALLDIDHFKKVNDTYGHDVGDVVLIHVAKILKDLARTTDFVARFGGEEFLLILPDTLQEGAYKVAEKIRSAIETSNPPTVKNITLSIGIATASEEDNHEDYVVKMADKALYQAKDEGRNRVVCSMQ